MHLKPVLIGNSKDAFRDGEPVYIVPEARRRHLAVFGGSGSGKSTLFRNMIAEDIAAGHGVTVVDPHGQLSMKFWRTTSHDTGRMTLYISIPRTGSARSRSICSTVPARTAWPCRLQCYQYFQAALG
jgi:DNA helicase HerA-like ATPase